MKVLNVISRLLDYPSDELVAHLDELTNWVAESDELDAPLRDMLLAFISHYERMDPLDWQSEYDGLFERGRAVSLHIFEHVHGESRDRGQAMVDLLERYRSAGLALSARELPDYLPTYLEFCATQGDAAYEWVHDITHVIALLSARLSQRESPYYLLMDALLQMAGVVVDLAALKEEVAGEARDDTPEALDKIWEEEVVSFTGANQCDQSITRPSAAQLRDGQPLTWTDATQNPAQPAPQE
ncbi:nitrate reductase molybdenum cofactor assembly chaperone [Microbulbifer sp. 2205BS26-8]|uniref:nitrate reductase molybdenum cofactor assembly chaperone n=1 Tax=Microbulbifer sp. 2205BS26-8 TaxID=3064386 RepID=UPI00273E4F72|nr:nitrate reductase molybdenum cofactor assembly chaperone [Microbulbifer sp. 2205BS26-8]MDP5208217.1 nitrate reductase molybdenum cofactor assembly chaperone [Microbulbifer sp. 2205BS26-8]